MNKWRIVFLMLFCGMILTSAQAVQLVPFTPHGVTCDLLQDNFENTDGVDITTHGWTAQGSDPGDRIEIDTAQFQGGSSSVLIDNNGDTSSYTVYRGFTQQTSGLFTIDFYARAPSLAASREARLIDLEVGVRSFPSTTILIVRRNEDDIEGYWGATWNAICTACISVDTWHHIEVEVDMTNNNYDVWLDDSQIGNNLSFQNNLDPDRIYLVKVGSTIGNNTWLDSLCMYSGARQ